MSHHLLDHLVTSASERFEHRYRRAPRWVVAAPGRVNLIGEHIDYNGGYVLPMAIDRYCVIAADRTAGNFASVFSVSANDEAAIQTQKPRCDETHGHWSNYVAGVVAGFAERGLSPGGFEAIIETGVPVGGGLSSSASIEVATATLIEAITGNTLEPVQKALLCQKAEHEYAGVPCGIMDQFASVMGRADHLMLLDCQSQQVEQIPFADPKVSVLIINSHVKHELAGGEYAQRRGQCESAASKLGVATLRDATLKQLEASRNKLDEAEYRRARHAIGEIARTIEAAAAVKAGDWPLMGRLMDASHDSLRDDYEVSCRELDLLVDLARELGPEGGVIGSRMTGGGFGGCTVSLVERDKIESAAQRIAQEYRAATEIEPSILISRPARGAHVIKSI
jgi:galactokinase